MIPTDKMGCAYSALGFGGCRYQGDALRYYGAHPWCSRMDTQIVLITQTQPAALFWKGGDSTRAV